MHKDDAMSKLIRAEEHPTPDLKYVSGCMLCSRPSGRKFSARQLGSAGSRQPPSKPQPQKQAGRSALAKLDAARGLRSRRLAGQGAQYPTKPKHPSPGKGNGQAQDAGGEAAADEEQVQPAGRLVQD